MIRWRRSSGISIFWQTFMLLVGSLTVVQAMSITILVMFAPPRPNFITLADVAAKLAPAEPSGRPGPTNSAALPLVTMAATPPVRSERMVERPRLTRMLADRLGVDPARVRIYATRDWSTYIPFGDGGATDEHVPQWQGEPLFFSRVVAGVDTGNGWRVLNASPPSREGRRIDPGLTALGLTFLILLVFAWFFARRLSRPIRQFAHSADTLGRDMSAPPVPAIGPAELRTTAQAINAMHDRIQAHLRERTAMIGALAHDLRTPLARIAFRLEAAPDAVREPALDDIEQMREMISATLDYAKARHQSAERDDCDLAALLRSVVADAAATNHDVTLAPPPPIQIRASRPALRRMFQNLLENAVNYGGGAHVSTTITDGWVRVEITDDGAGLPEHMVETVFDPFVRADPSRSRETGGVGLGLTIARAIAREHGGSLTLCNRPTGGLAAIVELPLSPPDPV